MTKPNKGGRPPTPPDLERIDVPLRLPRWLVAWIDAQGSTRAAVIYGALVKLHKLKPPKGK